MAKLPWYFSVDKAKGKNGISSDSEGHLFWNLKVNPVWYQYQRWKFIIIFITKKLWQ